MITFIYGGSGSGKSEYITNHLTDRIKAGGKAILLVPEQQAVEAERNVSLAAREKSAPTIDLEVLNFKRLCNRVFRQYGGILYNSIDDGGRALVMWKALFDTLPALREYSSGIENPSRFIPLLLKQISELKTYGILPSQLEETAAELPPESARLASKLSDIALIYSAYESIMKSSFEDSADDLTRLDEMLSENRFFEGYDVYIDSFSGFSPQEYKIMYHILRQADNVYIALCCDPRENQLMFENVLETARHLERIAGNRENISKIYLPSHPRFKNPSLSFVEENLFKAGKTDTYGGEPDGISIIEAQDIYTEAEIAARDITKKIREGAKYRDFAVIVRSESDYAGVIDSVFDKYQLSYHFSRRQELDQKPVFRLILSALNIKSGGWRLDDIIVYLKTGLCNLTPDECDIISDYAYRWSINGKRWHDGEDWYMNPDGYTERFTEESEELLRRVNDIKARVTAPLSDFFEYLDGKNTVKEISKALYDLLIALDVPAQMEASGGKEDVRLWGALCGALDQLVAILPDLRVNAAQYSQLISLVIKQTDSGTLPVTADEITVGSAGRLRVGKVSHVYLLGANEGIFPLSQTENGMLSDSEKTELETYGIVLSPGKAYTSVDELYYFYKAATAPSDTLTVIYSLSDLSGKALKMSFACERIKNIFPSLKIKSYASEPLISKLENMRASFEYAILLENTNLGRALCRIYSETDEYKELLISSRKPLTESEIQLSPETAKEIFSGDLALTQSRLDSYVMCAFGYHCKYVMKLSDRKKITFDSADTGTFIHHVLEKFLRAVCDGEKVNTDLSDHEIELMVEKIISDYLDDVFGEAGKGGIKRTNRVIELFIRLKRTVILLIHNLLDEFSQSDFIPRFFEMSIDSTGKDGTVSPLKIPLGDGSNVYIYGTIDRVDIFRKNGDVYFRVVDYKTGTKEFSAKDIEYGLNLQMLLYMFSIWQDKSGSFRRAVGCENGNIIPSGVLYCSMKTPDSTVRYGESEADILSLVSGKLKRSGMLINDEELLYAMEKKLSGKYIPAKVNKDDMIVPMAGLEMVGDFGAVLRSVSDKVAELGREIKSGIASASPLKDKTHDGCKYCGFKPVCRRFDFAEKEDNLNG